MSRESSRPNPTDSGGSGAGRRPGDALRAYRNLAPYRVSLVLEDDGWHVDYELKDPKRKGGGPHYVIDAATGAILGKRYEQ